MIPFKISISASFSLLESTIARYQAGVCNYLIAIFSFLPLKLCLGKALLCTDNLAEICAALLVGLFIGKIQLLEISLGATFFLSA